jgi:hypothetical protein
VGALGRLYQRFGWGKTLNFGSTYVSPNIEVKDTKSNQTFKKGWQFWNNVNASVYSLVYQEG